MFQLKEPGNFPLKSTLKLVFTSIFIPNLKESLIFYRFSTSFLTACHHVLHVVLECLNNI